MNAEGGIGKKNLQILLNTYFSITEEFATAITAPPPTITMRGTRGARSVARVGVMLSMLWLPLMTIRMTLLKNRRYSFEP
ncbi:hypothetical protein SB778_43740, partial [Paraburkholderia sp. SIMBA_050]